MKLELKFKTVNYICVDLPSRRFGTMHTYLEKFHPRGFKVSYNPGLFLNEPIRPITASIRISVPDLHAMAGYYRNVHKGPVRPTSGLYCPCR